MSDEWPLGYARTARLDEAELVEAYPQGDESFLSMASEAAEAMVAAGKIGPEETDGWVRLMSAFMALDSDDIVLEIDRAKFEQGRSFSAEAMDSFRWHVDGWVMARLWQHWESEQHPPQRIRLHLSLEVLR